MDLEFNQERGDHPEVLEIDKHEREKEMHRKRTYATFRTKRHDKVCMNESSTWNYYSIFCINYYYIVF